MIRHRICALSIVDGHGSNSWDRDVSLFFTKARLSHPTGCSEDRKAIRPLEQRYCSKRFATKDVGALHARIKSGPWRVYTTNMLGTILSVPGPRLCLPMMSVSGDGQHQCNSQTTQGGGPGTGTRNTARWQREAGIWGDTILAASRHRGTSPIWQCNRAFASDISVEWARHACLDSSDLQKYPPHPVQLCPLSPCPRSFLIHCNVAPIQNFDLQGEMARHKVESFQKP